MVLRRSNIQAHDNEAELCLNFGTPESNDFIIWDKWKNLLVLGVPIVKHIKVLRCICKGFTKFVGKESIMIE